MSPAESVRSSSEAFLVFQENRFAYTAVSSLKRLTGHRETPAAYIYGPSGVGKSHLVRHYLRLATREAANCRIVQSTGSEFAAKLAEASRDQTIAGFQESCRNLDIFVLEDLHALERRIESQQQFLAIFDELLAQGCQVILTSRKPPGELTDCSCRLINRCHGAILAQIKLPGPASRESLLAHFATGLQMPLSGDAVHVLAKAFPVSPRELRGILMQLENASRRERTHVDLAFVKRYLKAEIRPPQMKLGDIAKSVARYFDIPLTKLRSRERMRWLVLPRQCAMLLARELTEERLEQIGSYFGDRDHSTVVHSCNRLQRLLVDHPEIRQHLTQIRNDLGVA